LGPQDADELDNVIPYDRNQLGWEMSLPFSARLIVCGIAAGI
jgi:hypothetical protein